MDYKSVLLECETRSEMYKCSNAVWNRTHEQNCITAINDLLARAEAAEARCATLEKMVKEYQEKLLPGYRERAEKAEKCIAEIEDAIKFRRYSAAMLRISEYRGQKQV